MLIKEIKLLAHNKAATKYFYHQVLELPIAYADETIISFQAGTSILTFQEVKGKKAVYHFAFNIPCNKIKEALYWIKPKVEIIHADTENKIVDFKNWNAKAFYFLDIMKIY